MSTSNDGNQTYAAGWYADVNAPGFERWFDGTAWSEHVRPVQTQSAPEATIAPAATAAYPHTAVSSATTFTAPVFEAVAPRGDAPQSKAPWYKRKGIIIPVAIVGGIIVVSSIGGAMGGSRNVDAVADKPAVSQAGTEAEAKGAPAEVAAVVTVDMPNVVGMTGADAQSALVAVGFTVDAGGGDLTMPVTAQDIAAGTQAEQGSSVSLTLQEKPKLTLGQENAVRGAKQYLEFMPFSRAGLIQQLTSEYGSGFAAEDAEFAVASLEQTAQVDWNAEAAEAAQSYLDSMSFSRDGLYEQLTSEYGSGFTPDQANAGLTAVGY